MTEQDSTAFATPFTPIDLDKLHGTTDAAVWAATFVKTMRDHDCDPTDEGWLVGWFANAMAAQETADGHKAREIERHPYLFALGCLRTELWWKREKLRTWRRDHVRLADDVSGAIARKLPRRVRYWAAIDVAAHATTGKWGSQETPSVTIVEMLQRWDEDKESSGH